MQIPNGRKIRDEGVSEIMGALILLAFSVIIFSSLILYVLSETHTEAIIPDAILEGFIHENEEAIIIEHRGGDALQLEDTQIILWKGHEEPITITFDSAGMAYTHDARERGYVIEGSNNGWWNAGASFKYLFDEGLHFQEVRAIVIDTVSNSVVMSDNVQTSTSTTCLPTTPEETGES
jgi:hypothetical protein